MALIDSTDFVWQKFPSKNLSNNNHCVIVWINSVELTHLNGILLAVILF